MMAVLQATQGQPVPGSANPAPIRPSDALRDLFSQLDADSNGQISTSEFETALGAAGTDVEQADKVFGKMDKDADSSVSIANVRGAAKGIARQRPPLFSYHPQG